MWDHAEERQHVLSHDRPCLDCGHALHTFLPCSDDCRCRPQLIPGSLVRFSLA